MRKVTVVGAGKYGSTTAQRIAEMDLVDHVVLTDIVDGLPEGLALDINHSAAIEGFATHVIGQSQGYDQTADSDVVVITAGLPRKPGMSRMDLLETNAKIVADVTSNIKQYSPEAILIVVSNPLDEMTYLAQQVSGFEHHRVMGQAGMLDSARFRINIAREFGVGHHQIKALTLGSHGDTMVPIHSQTFVDGKPLSSIATAEQLERLAKQTAEGGAEVVALLKTGSAYFAPSSAAAAMVRAIVTDSNEVMPVCAWVNGEYGVHGVYLGVPAVLGKGGVKEIVELELTEDERQALVNASEAVRAKQGDVAEFVGV